MMKNRVTNIHFVGIGGVGMSGIAEVLHNLGFKVSGSDQARNAVTEHLSSLGIQVYPGHTAEHVNGADVVVTSTAVKKDNPEVVAALEQQIPVIPRALMLAELMRFRDGIAIAGTHGKTTTTSLTASILGAAGLDPTFVIGGKLNAAGTNARLGKGEYIVAEADESDASFLHLTPIMSVVTNIHFVGIGGSGMSGSAEVLHNLGFKISGSDQAKNAATEHLSSLGIQVYPGHTAEHVNGADVVVTSTAVKKENPEVVAALEQQIPVIPRALMLAELMRFRDGIAIAGTHGKTTTTSLTASILGAAGLDPTFVIGGKLNAAGTNARLGKGEYIVAEADESDASFLHLTPIMSVVTNIDEDHMDTYGHSVEKLHQAFVDFIHRMPFYGKAFLCIDSEHVRAILPKVSKPYATYGLDDTADIYATDIENIGAQMKFTVHVQMKGHEQEPFEVVLNMPGRHNVLNALAAIGVALEVGASVEAIQKGLLGFEGVGRRFQKYGDIKLPNGGTALLVDDYGHHPVEMAATLSAARGAYPEKRLVLAFQPHRYTRTRDLFEDFTKVLNTVDALVLTEVYAAGEEPIAAADSRALARAIRVLGKLEPIYCENVADLPEMLLNVLQDGDVVLNMGAGSINRVPAAMLELSKKA